MKIGMWLHHLFNPHCMECKNDNIELDRCKSCEVLEEQLAQANREKHDLLNTILQLSKPNAPVVEVPYTPQLDEVKPKFTPWRVKQAELEAADRENARILANKKKEIELAEKDYTVKVDPTIESLENEILGEKENATSNN